MDTQKMKVQKLVPTEYDGKWGFIDAATGEEGVPFIYDYAAVCMEGKCGFIDQTGKEVIPFIYDDARYFNKDGKAKVKLNGETFFIDVKGNRVE